MLVPFSRNTLLFNPFPSWAVLSWDLTWQFYDFFHWLWGLPVIIPLHRKIFICSVAASINGICVGTMAEKLHFFLNNNHNNYLEFKKGWVLSFVQAWLTDRGCSGAWSSADDCIPGWQRCNHTCGQVLGWMLPQPLAQDYQEWNQYWTYCYVQLLIFCFLLFIFI